MGHSRSKLTAESNASNSVLSGRTVLITGSSSGIGLETGRVLADRGARVVMLARDQTKNELCIAKLQKNVKKELGGSFIPMQVELNSLTSIKRFSDEYKALGWPIHTLICNAGICATEYGVTNDGIELQMGTNHIGHFYLTQQLLPVLLSTAATTPVRVVVISSESHRQYGYTPIQYDKLPALAAGKEKKYSPWAAYQQSKYANVLFAHELNKRYFSRNLTAYSLHPGVIITNISAHMGWMGTAFRTFGGPFTKSIEQGAATTVYCAVTPGLDTVEGGAGQYFENSTLDTTVFGGKFVKEGEAERLWDWSEKIVTEKTEGGAGSQQTGK